MLAALEGHNKVVKMLLTAGADINHSDRVLPVLHSIDS
jgi:hypothetical protein